MTNAIENVTESGIESVTKRGRKIGSTVSDDVKTKIGEKIKLTWALKHDKMKKYIKISCKTEEVDSIKKVLDDAGIQYDLVYIKGISTDTKRGRKTGSTMSDEAKSKIGDKIRAAWAAKRANKTGEQAYCMTCKEQVAMINPEQKSNKQGLPIMTGNCSKCNRKLIRFMKRS
jgi:hypothetical protein